MHMPFNPLSDLVDKIEVNYFLNIFVGGSLKRLHRLMKWTMLTFVQ